MITLYGYKKCSTCRKAEKFLEENHKNYEFIDIVTNPPSSAVLKKLLDQSGLDLKKFFNTSGELYRSMNMKDKLPHLSQTEAFKLLAANGKLIKRPLATDGHRVVVGYDEDGLNKLK